MEREVLCAEKVIAETKCKTLQQRLETEGKELLLMQDKITSLETDKRELTEALESAKNATAAIQAMHERSAARESQKNLKKRSKGQKSVCPWKYGCLVYTRRNGSVKFGWEKK
ncbi:unnamed protein product [Porites lobata]|uniref:Uncharacterized protein n=1 Tax=Porites lobata TaxID=104759 RepID=A0ABN8Q8R6_9CNID|nr:unnamed protein product [Porites lobata]